MTYQQAYKVYSNFLALQVFDSLLLIYCLFATGKRKQTSCKVIWVFLNNSDESVLLVQFFAKSI